MAPSATCVEERDSLYWKKKFEDMEKRESYWKKKSEETSKALEEVQSAYLSSMSARVLSVSQDRQDSGVASQLLKSSSEPNLSYQATSTMDSLVDRRKKEWQLRDRQLLSEKALLEAENADLKRQINIVESLMKRTSFAPALGHPEIAAKEHVLLQLEIDASLNERRLKNELSKLTSDNAHLLMLLKKRHEELYCTPRDKSSSSSGGGSTSTKSSDLSKSPQSMEYLDLLEYDRNSLGPISEERICRDLSSLALQEKYDTRMAEAIEADEKLLKIVAPCPMCFVPSLHKLELDRSSLRGEAELHCRDCGSATMLVIQMATYLVDDKLLM